MKLLISTKGQLLLIFLLGFILWQLPLPEGLTPKAWHLMAIFVATIVGLILSPYPLGAMAIFSVTIATTLGVISIKEALVGFSDPTIWMIACAFFISRSFIKTGFGRRIGYLFIQKLGHSALGLAYGLVLTDLIFAPAMPSTTARCGGIITPLFRSISEAYDSTPEQGTERRIGAFLVQCIFQCNAVTSAMFLTAMAGNPLVASIASQMGYEISWMMWAVAAVVPGLVCLIVVPLALYYFYPPELKNTAQMREVATQKLKEMGAMTRAEWVVLGVFISLVLLWVLGSTLHIHATLTAFIGVVILLITNTLTWDDMLSEKEAWHTVIWFAVLIMLASQLQQSGFIGWLGESIGVLVAGLPWMVVMLVMLLVYFYSHYMMASSVAHISAMYAIFVSITIAAGAPAMLTVLLFGMFSCLYMSLTHYSGGPAPILFGCRYLSLPAWWKVGFLTSLLTISIWLVIGTPWWKLIGLW